MPKQPGGARMVGRGKSANPAAGLVAKFAERFGAVGRVMIPVIHAQIRAGLTPLDAVNFAANQAQLEQVLTQATLSAMVQAVAIGYGIDPSLLLDPVGLRNTFLNEFWPGDEFNLSNRIASANLRKRIAGEIESSLHASKKLDSKVTAWTETARRIADLRDQGKRVISGELSKAANEVIHQARLAASGDAQAVASLSSVLKQAQRDLDRLSLRGAPNQAYKAGFQGVVDAASTLKSGALERAVRVAVTEKAQYHAERIARTETARAYGTGFHSRAEIDQDVIGVRSMLSSRHPENDICDFHANADLYGMGPGVTPKDKVPPYPYHPHCLCVLSLVYEGETEIGQYDKRGGLKYLAGLPMSQQRELLGAGGLDKFKANPKEWEKHLKGWEGHSKPKTYPVIPREAPHPFTPKESEEQPKQSEPITAPSIETAKPEVRKKDGPTGKPVSDAFVIESPKVRESFNRAVALIDSVHGDGVLPKIPVNTEVHGKSLGTYWSRTRYGGADQPVSIGIRPSGDHAELTAIHEIGHFLDNTAMNSIGGPGFGTSDSARFGKFFDAAKETESIQTIKKNNGKTRFDTGKGTAIHYKRDIGKYLLNRKEVWARAYAQYIAVETGDPILLRQLAALQKDREFFPTQWTDQEFEPLRLEITAILKDLKWRN